jgi:ech hydrogenase subunit B
MAPLAWGLVFIVVAPIFGGLLAGVDRILSARMQGRVGPPLMQPFYDLGKLFGKDARQVNPIAEPLLLGHVAFMALTGALVVSGTDLLFTAFVFALAALFLVLAAGSVNSPYSFAGAERELIVLLASEPFFILMLAAVCKVTGESTFGAVLASPVMVALQLPGIALAFLFVATIKLRKSPFDISTSHHPHQELVRGLTTDMSGRLIAWVELTHWYESALLALFMILLFNWSVPLGVVAFLVAYLLEVIVDNSTSRAKWQLVLRSTWVVTLVLSGGNVLALFLPRLAW